MNFWLYLISPLKDFLAYSQMNKWYKKIVIEDKVQGRSQGWHPTHWAGQMKNIIRELQGIVHVVCRLEIPKKVIFN